MGFIRAVIKLCLVIVGIGSFALNANAITPEQLFMPGKVIKGHAKYEDRCKLCHQPFKKKSQQALCLDCHKKIASDISKGRGFHGLSKDVKKTECKHCHTDHKGRDADIVRFDKEIFDHGVTDFPIKGRHKRVTCERCHEKGAKYREAPLKCIRCHKEDDRHRARLGKDCSRCHMEKGWREVRFSHDDLDFPLKGRHRDIPCGVCHVNERWKRLPRTCYSCHRLNDIHDLRYGRKCERCHNSKDWKKISFDHDETKFPLKGRHTRVECGLCHRGDVYKEKIGKTCYACHKNDDEHRGRYGKKCNTCHKESREWKHYTFNHSKTDYPLKGRHRRLDCDLCHKGRLYKEKLGTACYDCHRIDDVHRGKEGKRCGECHDERGWTKKVFFEHDITRFPLIGLHAVTLCEECHTTEAYRDTPTRCVECHKADDKHETRLGKRCGLCHNPNGWGLWEFDHDTETDYTLDGGHKGLKCEACHSKPVRGDIKISRSCYSCHRDDDIHTGEFGRYCERCHTTDSFNEIKILH